ncbi:MAG TPA: DUF1697 domain-containing protein [Ilumatobacteraceae bacterium]|nr:DUF1697 domain-containing protein [Ilumatobacteraceae bacterium]
MATWIVLLRAVNVGGRMLPMAELRKLLGSLGHSGVATYIQSGNAILTTSRRDRQALADEIAEEIERLHGLPVSVIMRTPEELQAVLAANPFSSVVETARVVITFLSRVPDPADAGRLEPERFAPDRFELRGSEIYAHYPNGIGPSKLTLDYFEKRLRVRGTARNVNTVTKLIELAEG